MDLSKLPKLSESTPPPPDAPGPAGPGASQPVGLDYHVPAPAEGPEALLAIAVGLIVSFLAGSFYPWAFSELFGTAFTTTFTDSGHPITYTKSWFFVGDLPIALLGLAMIFEGVAMLLRRHWLMGIALGVMALATLTAICAQIYLLSRSGIQLLLLIAATLGAYGSWVMLQRLGRPTR